MYKIERHTESEPWHWISSDTAYEDLSEALWVLKRARARYPFRFRIIRFEVLND